MLVTVIILAVALTDHFLISELGTLKAETSKSTK